MHASAESIRGRDPRLELPTGGTIVVTEEFESGTNHRRSRSESCATCHVHTAEEPDSASKNRHLPAAGIRPLGVFVPDHFSRGLHLDVEHREHAPASFAEALSSPNMGSTASNFSAAVVGP